MPEYEAGEWPVDYGQANCTVFESKLPSEHPDRVADQTRLDQLREDCEIVAINTLWNFTKRHFSLREVTLRPERTSSVKKPSTFEGRGPLVNYPAGNVLGWMPVMIEGRWFNLRCGSCGTSCTCDKPWSVSLPMVHEVLEVHVNGVLVDDEDYWLDKGCLINRVRNWPQTQDLRQPDGPGTWSVTYMAGTPVPRAGQLAAGTLACELGKAATKDSSCQLPSRVQSITRQGVTVAILDTFEDLEKGRTGLPQIDMWVQSVNVDRSAARLPASPDWRP